MSMNKFGISIGRSLLFAKLSSIAYNNIKKATSQAKMGLHYGDSTMEWSASISFADKSRYCYCMSGTQPNEFNDIKAILKHYQ